MSVFADQQTAALHERVSALLADGTIEAFVGYRQGSNALRVAPYVAESLSNVNRLIWNASCINNLVPVLLKHVGRRMGILLKGCDSRTLAELIRLNQLRREDLYVVGVPCPGMLDPQKVGVVCGPDPISTVAFQDDHVVITADQRTFVDRREALLYARCQQCPQPLPLLFDEMLDAPVVLPPPGNCQSVAAMALDQSSVAERFAFWSEQLGKCTLCYACQTVCPLCFCKQCPILLERSDPQRKQRSRQAVFAFHLLRAAHMADRCTGCDECERVCPADIPLSLIFKQVRELRP